MFIPSRGYIVGSADTLIDPHKVGRVLWSRTCHGHHVPVDLHNQLSLDDEVVLDKVLKALMGTKQVRAALDLVYGHDWSRMDLIKPWLMASMDGRAQARSMMATGEWAEFWNIRE